MCGILGVIGGEMTINTFLYCLELLSTRGQEAAGLTGFSNGFLSEKCEGTAAKLGQNLPNLTDRVRVAVGSTRYPTIGTLNNESVYAHIAPFTESTHMGLLSLTFNGNILSPKTKENGQVNDGALLTKLLKKGIEKYGSIYKAVQGILKRVDGAYSAIALLGDDKIIAFRDPHGFHPLCWGRLDGGFIVASETRILGKLGVKEFFSVPPGGMMVFSKGSYEIHRIVFGKPSYCMFEWTYFSQAPSVIEGKEVYQVRYKLGRFLGRLLKDRGIRDIDYVIPVPNTSRAAALGCSDYLGMRYADGLIKNVSGRIFIKPSREERANAVKDAYEVVSSVVNEANIVLIDDSIVRGTTLKKVIALLRDKGARTIHVGITTPMIKYPCPYGIDMSRPGELVASTKTVEDISLFLGCDSMTYITMEGLYEGIGISELCTACLDGTYPTFFAQKMMDNINKMKDEVRCYEQSFISR